MDNSLLYKEYTMEQYTRADGCVIVYGAHMHEVGKRMCATFPGEKIIYPTSMRECWDHLEELAFTRVQVRNGNCQLEEHKQDHRRINAIATVRMTEYGQYTHQIALSVQEYKTKVCEQCIQSARSIVVAMWDNSSELKRMIYRARQVFTLLVVLTDRNISPELSAAAHTHIFTDAESLRTSNLKTMRVYDILDVVAVSTK